MSRGQIIHSGHFMCSNLHDDLVPDEDEEDVEVDVVEDDDKSTEASSSVHHKNKVLDEKPVTFYKFGVGKTQSIAIDVSLNKLNKCIKVAYNKMTTPKWKDFKGLRLHWKQRVRLNNVIWRAYFIESSLRLEINALEVGDKRARAQRRRECLRLSPPTSNAYISRRTGVRENVQETNRKKEKAATNKPKKPFCYFTVPDDDTTHQKIEGSIVEGMYWKRKMEGVCAQYKRWRIRSKHSLIAEKGGMVTNCSSSSVSSLGGRKRKQPIRKETIVMEPPVKLQRSQTPKHTISDEFAWDFDDLDNVFTDDFLNSLSEPYMFPDPRDAYGGSNADIMQPGLLPLQPTIEDIMMSLSDMPDSPPYDRDTMRTPHDQRASTSSQEPPQMRRSASSSASLHQMQSLPQVPQQIQIQQPVARPPTQDFMAQSIMMDYRLMPTRQSSAITSQMLMLSQSASTSATQPQYATSSHYNQAFLPVRNMSAGQHHLQAVQAQHQWNKQQQQNFLVNFPHQSHVERILNNQPPLQPRPNLIPTPVDHYMPQFLQSSSSASIPAPTPPSSTQPPTPHDMAPSRSWWLDSPLTASVQSPLSVATPLPLANPSGPQTPLGQLMGDNGFLGGFKVQPSLSQRLEQPPIGHAPLGPPLGSAFGGIEQKQKVFLANTPSPLDFSGLSRLRTTSLNESWKVGGDSPTYQALAAATKPSVLPGDPPASVETPKIIVPPPSRQESALPTVIDRQQSCDVNLLNGEVKKEERNGGGSMTCDPKETPKEEPLPMSAPSSVKSMRRQAPDSTLHPEERKRILHLHAEQNRRSALKDGFDQLMDIIPDLYSGGVKPTNAVVLAKSADHIRRLQQEKWEKSQKIEEAKAKIEKLNQRITSIQSNLPQSSAPSSSSSQIDSKTSLETFFDRYVKEGAKKDWRFWVMSQMLKPICVTQSNSFAACVAGDSSSRNEVAASCSDWLKENWKAQELRPLASTLLVSLATNSSILAEPETLPDYVKQQLKNHF
uniref:BHLH domain-containing protein n=2 Tax=Caenorhabditis tropicalis TaxID=1561998 RepID=A0A1I7TWX0_9PELO